MNPPSSSPPPSLAPPHSDDYSGQSPPPDGPSPSYLEFASTTSKTLSEPTRKLLILDLNGTLLLRSPRASQVLPRPTPSAPRALPRHAPPVSHRFMRAWLDVMVWSSAQPHSVEDMMLDTFGRDRDNFLSIYARDTLGFTITTVRRPSLSTIPFLPMILLFHPLFFFGRSIYAHAPLTADRSVLIFRRVPHCQFTRLTVADACR